jgi:hypothetical protein
MTSDYFINHMLVFFNGTTSNIIDVTVRGGEVVTIVCLTKRKQSIDMILKFVMTMSDFSDTSQRPFPSERKISEPLATRSLAMKVHRETPTILPRLPRLK